MNWTLSIAISNPIYISTRCARESELRVLAIDKAYIPTYVRSTTCIIYQLLLANLSIFKLSFDQWQKKNFRTFLSLSLRAPRAFVRGHSIHMPRYLSRYVWGTKEQLPTRNEIIDVYYDLKIRSGINCDSKGCNYSCRFHASYRIRVR